MASVFITGATSGFGRACAEIFADKYELVLTGRREERLEELASRLSKKTKVKTLCFDIRDKSAIAENILSLGSDYTPEVLINNAGLALGVEKSPDASLDDWDQMIETNITGLVHTTRHLLPNMRKAGKGSIINMGSIAGSWPYPGSNVYGSTKAFVAQFSRNLRADLSGSGVRVCNIEPGLAETEFSVIRFHGDKEKAKTPYENTAALSAFDIAEQCLWVASRPQHVNINSIEIMPTSQSWGAMDVSRG